MFDFSQIVHMNATVTNTDRHLAALLRSSTSLSASAGNESQQLAQRISVTVSSPNRGLVLEFDAVVTLSLVEKPDQQKNALRVTWNSAGGGRFPSFGGVLGLERDHRESCRLVVEGAYEEEESFDASVFGVSPDYGICVSAARALLEEVRKHLERGIRTEPSETVLALPRRENLGTSRARTAFRMADLPQSDSPQAGTGTLDAIRIVDCSRALQSGPVRAGGYLLETAKRTLEIRQVSEIAERLTQEAGAFAKRPLAGWAFHLAASQDEVDPRDDDLRRQSNHA